MTGVHDPPPTTVYVQQQHQYGAWPQQQAVFSTPGYALPQTTTVVFASAPPSYMAWSILNLLFCCLPLGIAATAFSATVGDYAVLGNHAEAKRRSDVARVLNIVATVLGVVVWAVVGVVFGLYWDALFNAYYDIHP